MAKKNNLYINIKDDDTELEIVADFLRDGEISSRSNVALKAYYLSLSIARSPNSTPADIRKAEHYCLSQLKQHMIYIMDKHYRDDGIEMNADEFSTVTINQSLLSQLPNFNSIATQPENRGVTAAPLSPSNVNLPIVEKQLEDIDEEGEDEDDDYDDDDDYENMTKEERAAAMLKVMVMPVMKS